MKKIFYTMAILVGFCLMSNYSYAQPRTNASAVVVDLSNSASRGIVFVYPTRDLYIRNGDANDYVWIDLKSSTNGKNLTGTFNLGECMLLAPSGEEVFFDFITEGITVIKDTIYSGNGASPVSVEAIF